MSDKLDILIEKLGQDLKPVKPLGHPFPRTASLFICALIYMGAAILYIGLRSDVVDKLGQGSFLFEIGFSLVMAIAAALSTGWLSVPDMREQKWLLYPPFILFAVFILFIGIKSYSEGIGVPHNMIFHKCIKDALILACLPIAGFIALSRTGHTTHPVTLAAMSALSTGSLGWIALRLTCSNDTIGHNFFYHFIPFALIGIALGLLARKLYRW